MSEDRPSTRRRGGVFALGFTALLFSLLYWGYPFEGMILSDSWFLYATDGGEFRWWTKEQLDSRAPVVHPEEMAPFTPTLAQLVTRRGLMPVTVLAIDRLAVGSRPVFVNALCILVLVVNAGLFAWVVFRLAGPRFLFPALLCGLLYPFASGSHFWQYLIINNLAATFFLASLAAFLQVDLAANRFGPGAVGWIACSLTCFWLSLLFVDYAIFMGPLYLYLALYYSNGRKALVRFPRLVTPAAQVGLLFVGLTVAAVLLLGRGAPTFLVYTSRFEELASIVPLPPIALLALAVVLNGALFYVATALSNTVGFLLYPLATVGAHPEVLAASPRLLAGAALLGAAALWGLRASGVGESGEDLDADGAQRRRFLLLVGVLWALLAYLPFAAAFGYPRVVGLTADRANILAQWGVSLCAGALLHALYRGTACGSVAARSACRAVASLTIVILVGNLFIQREYYVEAYRKEEQLAKQVLDYADAYRAMGHTPIVLLDRKEKVTFPRAQLVGALEDGGARAWKLATFAVNRYFVQDYVTSSFHLDGLMLFGCCPNSATVTFNGYAKQWRRQPVLIFKAEPPFRVETPDQSYRVGYDDVNAWSKAPGAFLAREYPRRDYELVRVELGESVFRLRGALAYEARPYVAANGAGGRTGT